MRVRFLLPLTGAAALTIAIAAACSGHHGSRSRIEQVPLGRTLAIPGMDGTVEVVRDEFDQPHVYATTYPDTMRVLGWLHAEDRFIQMDLARRLGEGRLSELIGTLDPGALQADQRFRALGMSRAAQLSMDNGPASEL